MSIPRLLPVPSDLQGWVRHLWVLEPSEAVDWHEELWPSLEADVLLPVRTRFARRFGDRTVRVAGATIDAGPLGPRTFVHSGEDFVVGARLRPGGLSTLLGDERVGALEGEAVPPERLGLPPLEAEEPGEAPAQLLDWLRRAPRGAPPGPLLDVALDELARGRRIRTVAASTGLSERGLLRFVKGRTGLGPKSIQRLLRLRRMANLLRAGREPARGFAECAAEAGYSDQAHFCRECRDLTGRAPRAWWPSDSFKTSSGAGRHPPPEPPHGWRRPRSTP